MNRQIRYPKFNEEIARDLGDGLFEQSVFSDAWGRELEAHKCEYCGQVKPVKVGPGFLGKVLMRSFVNKNGKKVWRCNECAVDIINKS